jgi:hypothetical protein
MTTNSKGIQHRAAATAMKEQRARDAAEAMQEYEAEKLTIRANTARLRALRLAKEAGRVQDAKTGSPVERMSSRPRNSSGHKL